MGSQAAVEGWTWLTTPAVALVMLAVLIVLLRWTFSHRSSVTSTRAGGGAAGRSTRPEDYLVEAARYSNAIEAEYFSCVVSAAGIATAMKQSRGQSTLLVPASQREAAEALLRQYAL